MHRIQLALLTGALILLCVASLRAETVDRVVAKLNDDIITESDLADTLDDQPGPELKRPSERITSEALSLVLDRTLLLQSAKKQMLKVPDDELQKEVEDIVAETKSQYKSDAEFRADLAAHHTSLEKLKSDYLRRRTIEYKVVHAVTSRFMITDADVKHFEDEYRKQGHEPLLLRLRRLAVPLGNDSQDKAIARVTSLLDKINDANIGFAEGVKRYSEFPGAKEDGGDLGYLSADKLSKEVLAATQDLEPGQVSKPLIAGDYACIFYIEAKRGGRSLLFERKFDEQRKAMLIELRRNCHLEIYDERLRKLVPPEYQRALIHGRTEDPAATPASVEKPSTPKSGSPWKRWENDHGKPSPGGF